MPLIKEMSIKMQNILIRALKKSFQIENTERIIKILNNLNKFSILCKQSKKIVFLYLKYGK